MHWIHDYQLFLFDFDGILVNTEELHYLAYKKMCADRGFDLKWDLPTYIRHAMFHADGLQKGICQEFPALKEIDWPTLYQEKKNAYAELLQTRGTELMPGVEELLKALDTYEIKRCVVTHSAAEQVALIREQQPLLNTIPNWITRADYSEPKPSPECYLQAIAKLGDEGDRIIGFEDSPRGLKALLGTPAKSVLVTEMFSTDEVAQLSTELEKEFLHIASFGALN